MTTIKKLSFDMKSVKAGEIVNGKFKNIYIRSIRVNGNIAFVNWSFSENSDSYFSTDYRKSENIADYGIWHDLTTQQWNVR